MEQELAETKAMAEQERKEKELAEDRAEQERKEKEEILKNAIHFMNQSGMSMELISKALNISTELVLEVLKVK
jgi:peptidyl-tRNA hydrolase